MHLRLGTQGCRKETPESAFLSADMESTRRSEQYEDTDPCHKPPHKSKLVGYISCIPSEFEGQFSVRSLESSEDSQTTIVGVVLRESSNLAINDEP